MVDYVKLFAQLLEIEVRVARTLDWKIMDSEYDDDSQANAFDVLFKPQDEVHASLHLLRAWLGATFGGVAVGFALIGLLAGWFGSVLYCALLVALMAFASIFIGLNFDEWRREQINGLKLSPAGKLCMVTALVSAFPALFVVMITLYAVIDSSHTESAFFKFMVVLSILISTIGSLVYTRFIKPLVPDDDEAGYTD